MSEWKMLTLVGQDKPGIVAKITNALYAAGAQLGEASMMRLGGNFTIMLMVSCSMNDEELEQVIKPVAEGMNLTCACQTIEAHLHQHEIPDFNITVYGADRPGIVARATSHLLDAGFNILDLESDVGGEASDQIYIMRIAGTASGGEEAVQKAIEKIRQDGVNVDMVSIDTLIA